MKRQKTNRFVLGFVKVTGILPLLIFFKPKVYLMNKNCSRKLEKPSILMSNHMSLLDFPLYLLLFPFTTIHFLMAEVLFKKAKIFSWFLFKLGAIYVNRDSCDFGFIADSLEVLDKKGIVGIFPQGRLPVNGVPFPFKPGIVLVALRTDSPIIPVYTDGKYSLFSRAKVMIGEKIYLRDYISGDVSFDDETVNRLTSLLEEKTEELKIELEKRLSDENKKS